MKNQVHLKYKIKTSSKLEPKANRILDSVIALPEKGKTVTRAVKEEAMQCLRTLNRAKALEDSRILVCSRGMKSGCQTSRRS
jgi:hypothetical protein